MPFTAIILFVVRIEYQVFVMSHTFSKSDHIVGLLSRLTRSDRIDGQNTEGVDCEGLKFVDVVTRFVVKSRDPIICIPFTIFSDTKSLKQF